jgi:hypothetical protein
VTLKLPPPPPTLCLPGKVASADRTSTTTIISISNPTATNVPAVAASAPKWLVLTIFFSALISPYYVITAMKCRPTARSEATATRHIFVPEGLYSKLYRGYAELPRTPLLGTSVNKTSLLLAQ